MNEIRFWRAVFSLLALGVALVFLFHVWGVLIPFIIGLLIAYMVAPLVDRFVAIGFRRDRTVVVLYIALLSTTVGLGFWLLPALYHETNNFLRNFPSYTQLLNNFVTDINGEMQRLLGPVIGRRAENFVIPFSAERFVEGMAANIPQKLIGVAHAGFWTLIVPFVSFFALSQGRTWLDLLFDWTPSQYVESLLGLLAEVNATLGGYIRGQLLDAMCVGLVTIAGLLFLGFDGAILLGFITGLLNLVPFMAPIVGGGLALLFGYFQGLPTLTLFGIFLLFMLVRMLDDFFFMPFVVGNKVNLHPVVMLFAILAGFEIGGFLGLVFAVPAAAIIKVFLTIALHSRRRTMFLQMQHVIS